MDEKRYTHLEETLFFETLDNGLEVYIIPKPRYNKTYSAFITKFGSATNRFVPYGEEDYFDVPLGVAHFLEHKMFEMEDGEDAITLFANLGAEANAFTDYVQTAYVATSTTNTEEVIQLLLDYVQHIALTDENVAKEQGIITQELMMYLDKPSSRGHLGILENMFFKNPIREDIVGTKESIALTTKEVLTTCYNTFYHPSNMILMIVGNVVPQEILELVKKNQSQKAFMPPKDIKREMIIEENRVYRRSSKIKMDIVMPKVCIGLKLPHQEYQENELMLTEMKLKMILESTFGPASDTYQEMLDKELFNTGFSYNVYIDDYCGYVKIQANTFKDQEFTEYIKNKLLSLSEFEIDEDEFEKMKKAILGSFIKSFNQLEYIAHGFVDYKLKGSDLFLSVELGTKITIDDLKELRGLFVKKAISDFTILPK